MFFCAVVSDRREKFDRVEGDCLVMKCQIFRGKQTCYRSEY